jgi:hypothetical protein
MAKGYEARVHARHGDEVVDHRLELLVALDAHRDDGPPRALISLMLEMTFSLMPSSGTRKTLGTFSHTRSMDRA